MLPITLDVRGWPVLVVGGGPVAARRAGAAADAGAKVAVVAPKAVDALRLGAAEGRWTWHARAVVEGDLDGVRLVLAAVDDPALGRRVAAWARARSIWVNVADQPEACDFHVPAVVRRGDLSVAVATAGASPALAGELRRRLEDLLDRDLGAVVDAHRALRATAKAHVPDASRRAAVLKALARDAATFARARRHDPIDPAAWLDGALARLDAEAHGGPRAPGPAPQSGRVALVGAGPGRADWLTVRGRDLLAAADAVLYDALVYPDTLALARPGAFLHFVGRRAGEPRLSHQAIAQLMVALARRGLTVVRLKGGDPNVFAGCAEEAGPVRAAGVPCEIVPGVTAATGIAAAYDLTLTERGQSSVLTFVSGHEAPGASAVDWQGLARSGGTLAVYMPNDHLAPLAAALLAGGRPDSEPVALIADGTLPEAKEWVGTLAGMAGGEAPDFGYVPLLALVGETLGSLRQRARVQATQDGAAPSSPAASPTPSPAGAAGPGASGSRRRPG